MKHYLFTNSKRILPILITALCLLSACADMPPISDTNQQVSEDSRRTDSLSSSEISHIAYGDFLSSYVAAPSGLYLLQSIFPSSTSLCYIDMQTHQEIFLCSNPNCAHDSSNCTAYIPVTDGYFSYTLAYYQGNLYLFRTSGSDNQPPSLTKVSLDGTERRTILELQSGESFYGRAYGCDGAILAEISHIDESGNTKTTLEKIDLQSGERTLILTYPSSSYYSAITTVGNQLVYVTNINTDMQLFLYDVNSGKNLEIAAKENPLEEPYDGVEVSYIVNDPYLCGMVQSTNMITCQNLLTGQEWSFTSPHTESNEIVRGILPLYDQTFALTIEKDGIPVECLFDIETGQLTGIEYPQTKENMNQLIAEFGEQLLYKQAIVEYPIPRANQQGQVGEVCYLDQFAVVSKEDFENGVVGQTIELLEIE